MALPPTKCGEIGAFYPVFERSELSAEERHTTRTGTHGTQSLTLRDMSAIQQQIPLLAHLSPNVDLRVQVIFRDQNWATQVRGVTPAFMTVRGWRLAHGTFFTEDDVAAIRRSCVLGQT